MHSEKRSATNCIVSLALGCILLWRFLNSILPEKTVDPPENQSTGRRKSLDANYKRILLWTRLNERHVVFTRHNQSGWMEGCPEPRCYFDTSREDPQNAEAVFFSMPDFLDLNDRPKLREAHQYYVFYIDEAPDTMGNMAAWRKWDTLDGVFNLTMSYQKRSDVISDLYLDEYRPHIMEVNIRNPPSFHEKQGILWLVSHCRTASKRERYVKSLARHINIDQYGGCTDRPDPCQDGTSCNTSSLLSRYKFYLSFENSICKDYVTEKLMRALNSDVVPIVLGGANYSAILPASAYINVEDYETPAQLANYLQSLLQNETLYERHLTWKHLGQPLWQMPGTGHRRDNRFCKLCEILHRPPETRIRKTYSSIKKWFFESGQCRGPKKLI